MTIGLFFTLALLGSCAAGRTLPQEDLTALTGRQLKQSNAVAESVAIANGGSATASSTAIANGGGGSPRTKQCYAIANAYIQGTGSQGECYKYIIEQVLPNYEACCALCKSTATCNVFNFCGIADGCYDGYGDYYKYGWCQLRQQDYNGKWNYAQNKFIPFTAAYVQ